MAMAMMQCGSRSVFLAKPEVKSSSAVPEMLSFKPQGHSYWSWREHKVHFVAQGEGFPVLLVHGFGASVYHWRYNIPALAKHFEVYALDLLGFGWSDKPLIEYDPLLWSDQIADFLRQVVKRPAIVVGNSIGGLTVLQTAAQFPESVAALALVNPAGKFRNNAARSSIKIERVEETSFQWSAFNKFRDWATREALLLCFRQLNGRARIQAILNSVYKDRTNVDEFLINSILQPAADPNAAEVFVRMISRFLFRSSAASPDKLLAALSCPLLLLWGDFDPLAKPSTADSIEALYADNTTLVRLDAGHCPHDEVPDQVNRELIAWICSLQLASL